MGITGSSNHNFLVGILKSNVPALQSDVLSELALIQILIHIPLSIIYLDRYCYTYGNELLSFNIKNDKTKITLTHVIIDTSVIIFAKKAALTAFSISATNPLLFFNGRSEGDTVLYNK